MADAYEKIELAPKAPELQERVGNSHPVATVVQGSQRFDFTHPVAVRV